MGMAIFNKTVKITYVGDGVGCYLDSSSGMEYTYSKRETVFSKPKTPEEELRELLNELWNKNAGDFDEFVEVAIYHVIKKPQ